MTPLPVPAGIPRVLNTGAVTAGWVESGLGHDAETAVTDPGFCLGMAAAWQTLARRLGGSAPLTQDPAEIPLSHGLWQQIQAGPWACLVRGTRSELSELKKRSSFWDAVHGISSEYRVLPAGERPYDGAVA